MYPWGDERRFNSYARYFRELFGGRIQKVTVNAGFTCPNRDGTKGVAGCTFCNNEAFTPSYCMKGGDIEWQVREGIEFHRRRYRRATKFLVYFQSFSNTYADTETLRRLYCQALSLPEVAGLIIGTRPDCIDEEKLDMIASITEGKYVAIEYGVESCYDATLTAINRGHDFQTSVDAIKMTAERGIHTGAHFILGLPAETDEMLLSQTQAINDLNLTTVKFHQLQIFAGTSMALDYRANPHKYRFWQPDEYIELFSQILRRLRPDLVVERFASEAPPRFHAGPNWGLIRNDKLLTLLEQHLQTNDYHQGQLYSR